MNQPESDREAADRVAANRAAAIAFVKECEAEAAADPNGMLAAHIRMNRSLETVADILAKRAETNESGRPSLLTSRKYRESAMIIQTAKICPPDYLEQFRPPDPSQKWELVCGGTWSESPYHSGYSDYYITKDDRDGTWLIERVNRNGELDGVTQEEIDNGELNDDQIEALAGITLEEAQSIEIREIIAICSGAPDNATVEDMADVLYGAICDAGMGLEDYNGLGIIGQDYL
jgi:hypothetical protein